MSAFQVTETHIRTLVTAMMAAERRGFRLPSVPAAILDRHPQAFAPLIRKQGLPLPVCGYEDQIGAAMTLANVLACEARYPGDPAEASAEEADALTYRHAMLEADPVSLLKAFQCWAYQCAEDFEPARVWASEVEDAMRGYLITRLPGYEAAPWGIRDPIGGAPTPGTAGAPVSLMSLCKAK